VTYWPLENAEEPDEVRSLVQGFARVLPDDCPYGRPAGCRCAWCYTDESDPPPSAEVKSGGFLVPQALLDDYAGMGDALNDYLARGLRGELPPSPRREPKRHRCLACWLVSLLPGHGRCSHGYLESGCETCAEW
jgi:hypothetical protein